MRKVAESSARIVKIAESSAKHARFYDLKAIRRI